MRRAQSYKRRHQHHAAGVLHTSRERFHLGQAPWLSLQQLFTSQHRSLAPADAMNGAVTLIAIV